MFEWFTDLPELLKGLVFIVIGFILGTAWDINKSNKAKIDKDKSSSLALKNSLIENVNRIEKNRRILWHETDINKENSNNFNDTPFVLLDTAQITAYASLVESTEPESEIQLLNILHNLSTEMESLNHSIRDRDQFRVNQKATRPYTSTIINFGKRIGEGLSVVEELIRACQKLLN